MRPVAVAVGTPCRGTILVYYPQLLPKSNFIISYKSPLPPPGSTAEMGSGANSDCVLVQAIAKANEPINAVPSRWKIVRFCNEEAGRMRSVAVEFATQS